MDSGDYLKSMRAKADRMRGIAAMAAFLMAGGSIVAGAVFNVAVLVVIMVLASVTVGVFTFYRLACRLGWNSPDTVLAQGARWHRIALSGAFLAVTCALAVWVGWEFGAVPAAWSSLTVFCGEFILGRELALLGARKTGAGGEVKPLDSSG
ncbi:hypothetical protein GCM10027059_42140 [Myceligenerans halotolerans]